MVIPIPAPIERLLGTLGIDGQLEHISPTSLPQFLECKLRGVWGATRQPQALPSGPAARLGSVIHRLLEEAGNGSLDPQPASELTDRWNELVRYAEDAMLARPLERRYVPLSKNVKRFEVLRLKALARAKELAEQAAGGKSAAVTQPCGPARFGFELPVASTDGLIAGKIDRVTQSVAGAVVQDYKSGSIFSDTEGQPAIKHEYEVQLKMYGALYAEQTGDWPAKLELIPLDGDAQEIPFSRDECVNLVGTARSTLNSINGVIHASQGNHDQLEDLLADPSPAACKYCPYRPCCGVYLATLPHDESDWPTDIFGRLTSIKSLANGAYILEIRASNDALRYVRDVTETALLDAEISDTDQGKLIGVFNALRTKSPQAFEARTFTTILKESID